MTAHLRCRENGRWLTKPEYFRTVVEAERRAEAVAQRLPAELEVYVLEDCRPGGFWVCFAGWVPPAAWTEGRVIAAIEGSRE